MGFPSPARDFMEPALTPNYICGITPSSHVIETSSGYAVIEPEHQPVQGDRVLLSFCGRVQFAKIMGHSFVCDDGDTIEGEACSDARVLGVVTFTVTDHYKRDARDGSPV